MMLQVRLKLLHINIKFIIIQNITYEKDTESIVILERAVQLDEIAGSGIAENVQGILFTTHLFAFLFSYYLLFFANFNCKTQELINKINKSPSP